MPSFVCDLCQSTLKKNQLDAHKKRPSCSQSSVSCIDCGASFADTQYRSHTSCITEAEKYRHNAGTTNAKRNKPESRMDNGKKITENDLSNGKEKQLTALKNEQCSQQSTLYSLYKKSKLSKKEFLKSYLVRSSDSGLIISQRD